MSVSMTKSDGVTVVTLKSDPGSACPPLCQILKTLCYSPVCCSVSQKLRSVLGTSHTALGTVQIMVGLLNIGLGSLLSASRWGSSWTMDRTHYPFWMGALFIFFGTLCILSEKFPSPCLVASSVCAHLAGVAFAITAVVLYSTNLPEISFRWLCTKDNYYRNSWNEPSLPPPTQEEMNRCLEGKRIIQMVLGGVNVVLIVLSVLQLCVSISCVILGIKAMRKSFKKTDQSEDPEHYTPLMADKSAY